MELWFSEFHAPDVKHSIRVNRHLYSHKSPYQQIDIYETPEFGKVLSLDGNVMLTERDEFIYDEMITHVPMAVHPGIKNVLVPYDIPLIVDEALMVEPTETESKETLDDAIAVFRKLYELAGTDPEKLHQAPVTTPVTRLDEVNAARHPHLRYAF